MPVSISLSATQVCTAGPSAAKSCAAGSTLGCSESDKYPYFDACMLRVLRTRLAVSGLEVSALTADTSRSTA